MFSRGRLVFDGAGKVAVKLMLKTWVKQAGIRDADVYFSIKDAKGEMECWSPLLSVSRCGYMQGYQKLEEPGVRPIHQLMAKIVDGPLHAEYYLSLTREDLAPWEGRVLLVLSEDDTTFTPTCKKDLIDLMPKPTVVTNLTGEHLALMVRLDEYAELVTKFIKTRI